MAVYISFGKEMRAGRIEELENAEINAELTNQGFSSSTSSLDFPKSFEGLDIAEFTDQGHFHVFYRALDITPLSAPSGAYDALRRSICQAILPHKQEHYWQNAARETGELLDGSGNIYDIPFMDIINSSDSDGIITEPGLRRLHKSFVWAQGTLDGTSNTKAIEDIIKETFQQQGWTKYENLYDWLFTNIEEVLNHPNPVIAY